MLSSLASSSSFRELERKLQQMTKDELERICTERGFELITDELDDETGQPIVSTHQDYVDAAWQCLQMYVLLCMSHVCVCCCCLL
jgi:maleate cis-trans isomerase